MEEHDFIDHRYKWDEDYVRQAYELALLGLTQEQMARVLDVNPATFSGWKKKYPDFEKALREGQEVADAKVATSFYKRATGYEYTEEHFYTDKEGNGKVVEVRKHMPAHPWAASRWLALRQKAQWSESPKAIEQNNTINVLNLDLTGIPYDKLLILEEIGLKQLPGNGGGN